MSIRFSWNKPAERPAPAFEPAETASDRACCCPTAPAVTVLMPPTSARPYPVDLLLCRHHCRVSRKALERVGAILLDMPDAPGEDVPARAH